LFKVLSVRTALSIQAHPNKPLAEKLHVALPDKYADTNHKPEIAIALEDNFLACYGFCSPEVIQANLKENPVLAEIFPLGAEPDAQFLKDAVQKMFFDLDTAENKEKLADYISRINAHVKSLDQATLSEHQKLHLRLVEQYGTCDIGIIFTFFFNILRLKKGESFVISPDEPHAYIAGDIVEAMVASDNVVRGGLTPKFKDTKTLVEMLIYEFKERRQNSGECLHDQDGYKVTAYKTGYTEFMVTNIHSSTNEKPNFGHTFKSLSIAIVLSGTAEAEFGDFGTITLDEKTPYFIMPNQEFHLKKTSEDDLSIFICSCDI